MYVEIVYHRGPSCEHDPNRECTACFNEGLIECLGSRQDADELWEACNVRTPRARDIAQSLTTFEGDMPQPPQPACFIP